MDIDLATLDDSNLVVFGGDRILLADLHREYFSKIKDIFASGKFEIRQFTVVSANHLVGVEV